MQPAISVREFRSDDARHMARLHKESEQCFEERDIDEGFILGVAGRSDFRFYVASAGSGIVGFCGVMFYPHVGRAEIGPIAVDARYRNRKIAAKLLAGTEDFLRKSAIHRVIARVKAQNSNAVRFFLSMGFQEEGFFRRYTRNNEDVVQYVKFLL